MSESKTCFVLMPFSDTKPLKGSEIKSLNANDWEFIYRTWIAKAVANYPYEKIICMRSPLQPGNFIKGIIQDILNSNIVIADLTGQKPNVFYELGIRHALKLGTLIISQELSALPSDLKNYYCFEYKYKVGYEGEIAYKEFEGQLHERLSFILSKDGSHSDNPVSDFVDLDHYFANDVRKRQLKKYKLWLEDFIYISENYTQRIQDILKNKQFYNNSLPPHFINLHLFDATYLSFFSSDYSRIENEILSDTKKYLRAFSNTFHSLEQYWDSVNRNMNNKNITSFISKLDKALIEQSEMSSNLNEIYLTVSDKLVSH